MDTLNKIFSYYDNLISSLPIGTQAVISLILLLVLIYQIIMIFKSGHWIFIATLIVLLPGTWPAARKIAEFAWLVIKFLFVRALGLLS